MDALWLNMQGNEFSYKEVVAMIEDALDWLDELDEQGRSEEVLRVESEYMRMKLEAEDEANRLLIYPLEQMD